MYSSGVDKENAVFRRPALKEDTDGCAATPLPDTPKRAALRQLVGCNAPRVQPVSHGCSWTLGSPSLGAAAVLARRLVATTPQTPRTPVAVVTTPRCVGRSTAHYTPVRSQPTGHSGVPTHNPFESVDSMVSFSLPASSPSLFERVLSPGAKEEPGWDIEHISQLDPVQIEVTSYQRQLMCQNYDVHTEHQVQKAIDKFFSSGKIVPSPWGGLQKPCQPAEATASSSATPKLAGRVASAAAGGAVPHPAGGGSSQRSSAHIGTQTALSLPPQLPEHLLQLLSAYMDDQSCSPVPTEQEKDDSMLSNSTLRRKLLFDVAQADGDDEPPQADVSMADANSSVYRFPVSPQTGQLENSPQLYSTHVSRTTPGRQMDSPPVSPLCPSRMTSSPSSVSVCSQGLGKIRYSSSELSEVEEASYLPLLDMSCGGAAAEDGLPAAAALSPGGRQEDTGFQDSRQGGGSVSSRLLAGGGAPCCSHDAGYQSTLASISSLSHFLAGPEDGGGPQLHSTGLEQLRPASPLLHISSLVAVEESAAGAMESSLWREETIDQPPGSPVPIGSSTPGRSGPR